MNRTDPNAPQPLIGRDDSEPGYWAIAALDNPWSRERRNAHNNDTTLHALRQGYLLRESGLRESRDHFDCQRFYRAIGSRTENVEALMAQAIGHKMVPERQCDSCKQGQGPFASCIIVPGIFDECANCYWSQ